MDTLKSVKYQLILIFIAWIALIIFALSGCTKANYKPDHDQVSCERCIAIITKWKELEMIHIIGDHDTLVNRVLCEGWLNDFKRMSVDTVAKICNTNGESIYWIQYKDTSFISK